MDIKRDKYLRDLVNRMYNGMIKVVTGIRRCGKSYLLFHIFKNYLLEQGVTEDHMIMIELDQRKNKKYRDPDAILEHIESLGMLTGGKTAQQMMDRLKEEKSLHFSGGLV